MRTQKDIKQITILTEAVGVHGWVVSIRYKDGRIAELSIDYGLGDDMLKLTFETIKRKLKEGP